MRDLRDWMSALAAVGLLAIAATALAAGRRSALARPVAALCFVLFGWNFSTLAAHLVGGSGFAVLDEVFTSLSPPLVLEVVLRFTGGARRFRRVRSLAWAGFGILAIVSALGIASPPIRAWCDGEGWAAIFLVAWLPSLVFQLYVLVTHLVASSDPAEKARTRTVLAALTIGATFSTSDVLHGLGLPLPYLGAVGTLVSAGLLATCAVRFELFDRNIEARSIVYLLAMIGTFLALYLVLYRLFGSSVLAQVIAATFVILLVVAVGRELALGLAETRARTQRLTVLGRFSAQMAHDLRSPLAALLGAAQVLEGIDESPKGATSRKEFLELAVSQAKRISAIVDRYDRMGRIEPQLTRVRVNEVVRAVARLHGVGKLELDPTNPECDADRDLLESALENVVRNAVEAKGPVHIMTTHDEAAGRLLLRVIDEGEGMDARQRERAFEDFFTTKETGSGLGLAFARRVLVAHGGDVTLTSARGKGTTVELRLPI